MPRLIVIKGADEGKQFELTGNMLSIGREASNQLRLHDTEVSRRHAEFHAVEGGNYRLVDVGSANGTFVNSQMQREAALQSGDHIQIGQSILVYSAGRAGTPAESDLADKISMITRNDVELSSAIVKTIEDSEGSRILAQPEAASTPWLRSALANLGIMYETVQAVSHILDLDQMLERIMDLIFRSIEADRGCIMLRHPDSGQFEPKAVRWRQKVDNQEKFALSRTIMEYVMREKQGILVADASRDQRFNMGQSIVRFGIREVICVPMKGRHDVLGVLYLDTHSNARDLIIRNATSRFDEDHLRLASAISHQAALAVEDTRYHHAMVQAERLAAVGQTIAALSHNIKNILQGLRAGSDIFKMGLNDKNDEMIHQGWLLMEKGQAKIYNLVMDMLSYSKEREPAIQDTDLNQLTTEVVEFLKGRAREINARLEIKVDPKLPKVPADPDGIHRALLNIISNAIDAVDDRPQPQVLVTTAMEGKWALINVIDNGGGIPENKTHEVFRPFFSTKGSKGTGLGLAVSRKILREHSGDIDIKSQPGKGTRMILRLPLKSPAAADASGSFGSTRKLPSLPEGTLPPQNPHRPAQG